MFMILGIDPGIRKLGYAVVDYDSSIIDAGVLILDTHTSTRNAQYQRMQEIFDFFSQLLQKYVIKQVCIERYYFTTYNQANAEFVYGVRGIIMVLAKKYNCLIREYTPMQLKKAITGNGKASKHVIQKVIMKLFNLHEIPKYHDTADALGLARLATKK